MCNKRLGLAISKKKKKNLYQAKEQTLPAKVQNYRPRKNSDFGPWESQKVKFLFWVGHFIRIYLKCFQE
jgi:hypothetical protein